MVGAGLVPVLKIYCKDHSHNHGNLVTLTTFRPDDHDRALGRRCQLIAPA